jgi:hypothetical protein
MLDPDPDEMNADPQPPLQARRPSTNRSNSRPAVIREESHHEGPYLTSSTFSTGREFAAVVISEGGGGEGVVDRRQAESLVIREQQLGRSDGYGRSGRSQNGDVATARVGEEPAAAAGRQAHSSRAAGSSRRERESEWREERSEKRPEADKALHKLRNGSLLDF